MNKKVIICGVLSVAAAGLGVLGYIKRDIIKKGYENLKDRVVNALVNFEEDEQDV